MADEARKQARGGAGRFIFSVDPARTSMDAVARTLGERGVTVAERLDFINTLIVTGEETAVREAAKGMDGVTGIEPEGTMRAQ